MQSPTLSLRNASGDRGFCRGIQTAPSCYGGQSQHWYRYLSHVQSWATSTCLEVAQTFYKKKAHRPISVRWVPCLAKFGRCSGSLSGSWCLSAMPDLVRHLSGCTVHGTVRTIELIVVRDGITSSALERCHDDESRHQDQKSEEKGGKPGGHRVPPGRQLTILYPYHNLS